MPVCSMPVLSASENQAIRPSLLRKVAIITRAANQVTVSHALFSFSTSSQLNTPESKSSERPMKAVAVGSTAKALPKSMAGTPAHKTSSRAKMASMIFSPRFIGPCSVRRSLANCAALGVALISGGQRK